MRQRLLRRHSVIPQPSPPRHYLLNILPAPVRSTTQPCLACVCWRILADVTASNDKPYPAPAVRAALLADLNRRFRLPLVSYFGRRVANTAEAEDLTQDVFERLLKNLSNQPIANVEALIFRIAVNLLRDRARKSRVRGIQEPIPEESLGDFAEALTVDLSPERVVMGERTLEEVLAALGELGERTRAMFILYRFEQLKIREIAQMYGISASGVEKQVSKALMHLAHRLGAE